MKSSEPALMVLVEMFQNSYQHLASAKKFSSRFPYMFCMFFAISMYSGIDRVLKFFRCKTNKSKAPEFFSEKRFSNAAISGSRYGTKTVLRKYSSGVSAGVFVRCF